MNILGLNAVFHESSVALLHDGHLSSLVEEERYSRIRHAKSATIENTSVLPYIAIDEALRYGNCRYQDLDCIAYSFDPAARRGAIGRIADDPGIPDGDYGSISGENRFCDLIEQTPNLLKEHYGHEVPLLYVPHHLSHLASAYYSCPWDDAALLTIDGIGEDDTVSWGIGRDNKVSVTGNLAYPHSLGFLWEKITKFLGMTPNWEEGTVMALAAFGDPARYRDAFRKICAINDDGSFTIDHHITRFRSSDIKGFEPALGRARKKDHLLLYKGTDRKHADIAAALQELTEEIMVNLARRLCRETGMKHLAIAGGVALNCVANTKIAATEIFDGIWVVPAANDAGTAFGAAAYAHQLKTGSGKREEWRHAFFAVPNAPDAVERALAECNLSVSALDEENLLDKSAGLLSEGKVVGWYEGRMEVGPRALCHRSLLADPRSSAMKDHINIEVKHRQPFRPFGPVVREEDADRFFEIPAAARYPAKFMLAAVKVKPEAVALIPAALHADGTTRPQVVDKENHPRLHRLLGKMKEKTGVPVLINTSFNDKEPIVATPGHALATYLRTNIDALVLENRLLEKP